MHMSDALERASCFVLEQAATGFPDACHTMSFPHAAGFTGASERQASGLFTRAILAGALLDSAALAPAGATWAAQFRAIASQEATYLAQARDVTGSWRYFPGLPELPPDLDSLAAIHTLFQRIAPHQVPLCAASLTVALGQCRPDGSRSTWLLADEDPAYTHTGMQRAIQQHWGDSLDIDVLARFYHSLWLTHQPAYAPVIEAGVRLVLEHQQPDGTWPTSWYWGTLYSLTLCLELLAGVGADEAAQERALAYVVQTQHPDGGWGVWQSVPLETALGLWTWARWGKTTSTISPDVEKGVLWLLDRQAQDGRWVGTPWIKMAIGRAQGQIKRIATFQSDTLTTLLTLRTLLLLT